MVSPNFDLIEIPLEVTANSENLVVLFFGTVFVEKKRTQAYSGNRPKWMAAHFGHLWHRLF